MTMRSAEPFEVLPHNVPRLTLVGFLIETNLNDAVPDLDGKALELERFIFAFERSRRNDSTPQTTLRVHERIIAASPECTCPQESQDASRWNRRR